eukprot:jgi/Mesen1/2648/ME000166S01770
MSALWTTLFPRSIGLLVYQYFSQKDVTVQNILPASGREVESYRNDLEYNVTIISSMKCIQLLPTYNMLTMGTGEVDKRVYNSSSTLDIRCYDTPQGPLMRTLCPACVVGSDNYISNFTFVDIPEQGLVASAVGYRFLVTAIGNTSKGGQRRSIVSGELQAGSNGTFAPPSSIRGGSPSVLYFRFIPRLFKDKNDLRLMQITFHEFVTGTSFSDQTTLQAAVENATAAVTVLVQSEILSAFIVQTEVQASIGILSFLAKVGGIYQLGVLLFFTTLNMSERYVKFLRYDDKLLNRLEKQRVARYYWRKLRIAVKFGGFLQASEKKPMPDTSAVLAPGPQQSTMMRSVTASLKRLESIGVRSKPLSPGAAPPATSASLPSTGAAGSAPKKGFLGGLLGGGGPAYHIPNRKTFGVSPSMEEKARRDLVAEYSPGGAHGAPPSLGQEEDTLQVDNTSRTNVAAAAAGPAHVKGGGGGAHLSQPIEKLGQGISNIGHGLGVGVAGTFRVTSHVAGKLGANLTHLRRDKSGGAPDNPHVAPSDLLANTAGEAAAPIQKKKKKVAGRDTRLGSLSEHKGSVVRRFRSPSWIPHYQDLPAVPDPEVLEEDERKKREEKQKRAAERKRLLEEAQLKRISEHADSNNLPQGQADSSHISSSDSDSDGDNGRGNGAQKPDDAVDPVDLYNYLVDLHDYQDRLRHDFLAAQSMLENLVQRFRPHSDL